MSTKKLSKTILEAGKLNESKYDSKINAKKERAATRKYMAKIVVDPDGAEEYVPPQRKKASKLQGDKLGAVYRFIDSWVDRSWDQCYSEMKKKFQPKTLHGYHILHDHIMQHIIYPNKDAVEHGWYSKYSDAYYIDDDKILRKIKRQPKSGLKNFNYKELSDWLGKRKIGKIGNKYFWFIGPIGDWHWQRLYYLDAHFIKNGCVVGFQPTIYNTPMTAPFRQDRELIPKELEYFKNLPKNIRDEVLTQCPIEIKKRRKEIKIKENKDRYGL